MIFQKHSEADYPAYKSNKLIITFIILLFGVNLIAQNLNVTFKSQLNYPGQTCANICGYVDQAGNEYALVGASGGMSIVDVTNTAAPVEVIQIPGVINLWREIKVRGNYAYVTTEGGGGLQIVNLSSLPNVNGITYHNWTGDGVVAAQLNSIHALHIDNNFIYLYGSNLFDGAAVVADITDPWNPVYVGKYQAGNGNSYVHDGYVRNDTLYAAHISSGYFSIVDFSDKTNPIELINQFTPNNFTHNTWLSQNSKVLFTTDEVDDSYLTSYDISDLSNINELDRIQSNPGSGSMVHNTHIINVLGNDYAVTSWYKDGFTIVDAGRPQNLVQVGNYDTYSGFGNGSTGNWGVYPYLPSGTIVVSNIDEGLFVFSPTYVRACYLEGVATSACGEELNGVQISISAANINETTDIVGQYRTGTPAPGTYSVTFSKSGYVSQTISGVILTPGAVTLLDVQLSPVGNSFTVNGLAINAANTTPLAGVDISISNSSNAYSFVTNGTGTFSSCNVLSASDYFLNVGKWGYTTYCASDVTIDQANNALSFPLTKGYYDDFAFDFGWTVNSTASTGVWQRGVPLGTDYNGTPANPGIDDTTDCSNMAYVTGNTGLSGTDQDIDDGATTLTSPLFDLTSYSVPYLDYTRWFYNAGGAGISTPNDSLNIYLSNGTQTVLVEYVIPATPGSSKWIHKSFKISDYINPTATMQLIVKTADTNPGNVVEAGFDKFLINEGPTGIIESAIKAKGEISVFPNPFTTETTISYQLKNKLAPNASIMVCDIAGRVIKQVALEHSNGRIELNTSLNPGLYLIRIQNGNELIEPVKVVKIK
ncbi:MAG: choice-of-anchor B family protein [Bacteroidota bacterium]